MSAVPLHTLNPSEVWEALEASPSGLAPDSVAQRLALYGANALREPPPQPAWRLLLSQGSHPMALVLLGAGGLAMIGGRLVLGLVIWGVVAVGSKGIPPEIQIRFLRPGKIAMLRAN